MVNRLAAWLWPARTLPKIDHRQPVSGAHCTLVVVHGTAHLGESRRSTCIDNMEIGYLANTDHNVRFAVLADLKGARRAATCRRTTRSSRPRGAASRSSTTGTVCRASARSACSCAAAPAASTTRHGWAGSASAAHSPSSAACSGAPPTPRSRSWTADAAHLPRRHVRHHARHRHGAAARRRPQAHLHDRAPAQPRAAGPGQRARSGAATASSSRACRCRSRAPTAACSRGSTRGSPASTPTPAPYRTRTRTCSARGRSPARASSRWTSSTPCSATASARTRCSRTTCSKARTCARRWPRDVEVLDDQPASYISHCARLHRWVRGDWQTLPWLLPARPHAGRHARRNPLTRPAPLEDRRQPPTERSIRH